MKKSGKILNNEKDNYQNPGFKTPNLNQAEEQKPKKTAKKSQQNQSSPSSQQPKQSNIDNAVDDKKTHLVMS